jgi:hypothetical protein
VPALVAGAPAPEPPPTCDESAGPLVFTAPEELDVELPPPDPAVLGSHTTPPVAVTLAPAAEAGEMSDEPGVGLEQVRMAPPIETAAAPPNGLPIPPAIQDSGPNPASIARCSSASITNTGRSRGGGEVRRFEKRMDTSLAWPAGTGSSPPQGSTIGKAFNRVNKSVRRLTRPAAVAPSPADGIGLRDRQRSILMPAEGHRPGVQAIVTLSSSEGTL